MSLLLRRRDQMQPVALGTAFTVMAGTVLLHGEYLFSMKLPSTRPSLLPNKRLKLPAPLVCGKLSFVMIPVRRRSLGALR